MVTRTYGAQDGLEAIVGNGSGNSDGARDGMARSEPARAELNALAHVKRYVSDVTLFSDPTLRIELARLLGLDWARIYSDRKMLGLAHSSPPEVPTRAEAEQAVLDAMATVPIETLLQCSAMNGAVRRLSTSLADAGEAELARRGLKW